MRRVGFLALLVLGLPWLPAGTARAESYAQADAALKQRLATAYTELAAWCVDKQLFLARDGLAETILTLDADHAKARAWLKFKRGRDGSWTRRGAYKPPKNRKPQHLEAFAARKEAILTDLRPRVVEAIRTAEPALDHQGRLDAVAAWRKIVGDTDALMALAGFTRHEGDWRSTDTVRSLERRAAIRTAGQTARAAKRGIGARELPAPARTVPLPWKPGRGTKRVAAYGTVSKSTLDSCVGIVHATEDLMTTLFGGSFETRPYFALYVLAGREDYRAMIDGHPTVQGDRKLLRDLSGAYVGHGQFVELVQTPGGTLDSCISVTTQHLLSLRYAEGRSTWMTGWIADGFALYNMTWLTGTHLSFTVDFGRYGQDPLFKSLFSSATDWFAAARALMLSEDPATLRLSLGLKVGRMGPRDFLASYAFVSWLMEARSRTEVDALLRALAAGKDLDQAFATSLEMTVEDAQARLVQWLREMSAE